MLRLARDADELGRLTLELLWNTAVWSEALLTSSPSSFDESAQVSSKPGALHGDPDDLLAHPKFELPPDRVPADHAGRSWRARRRHTRSRRCFAPHLCVTDLRQPLPVSARVLARSRHSSLTGRSPAVAPI